MSRPDGTIALSASVHRALIIELIAHAPTAVLDDVVRATCERIRADEASELGHPSLIDRARRLLEVFDSSVHLAPVISDTLSTKSLRSLLVLGLDRFAIGGSPSDVAAVARACERFLAAVREPAVDEVVRTDPRLSPAFPTTPDGSAIP